MFFVLKNLPSLLVVAGSLLVITLLLEVPLSSATSIKCFKEDDTEETCTSQNHTGCAFNLTGGGSKTYGGGCMAGCGSREKGPLIGKPDKIACTLPGGHCCCLGNAQVACNDLSRNEVKEEACKLSIFKDRAPPGFCKPGVCKKGNASEETCGHGQNYCSILLEPDSLAGFGGGCTNLSSGGGCGGGFWPTSKEIVCSSWNNEGPCCCFADTEVACNVLIPGSPGCKLRQTRRLEVCRDPKEIGGRGNGEGAQGQIEEEGDDKDMGIRVEVDKILGMILMGFVMLF